MPFAQQGKGSGGGSIASRSTRDGASGGAAGAGQAAKPSADPVTAAKEHCIRLLTVRPRTRQELSEALARKGIEAETIDCVLARFDEAGLVDDKAFAEQWVRSRHGYSGLARRALVAELRRKGVDGSVAAGAAAEVDSAAEEERARELVRKRLRGMSTQDEQTKVRRLVGSLARKGYPEGLAYRVVREELAEAGEQTGLLDELPSE